MTNNLKEIEEAPPILSKWSILYWIVMLNLVGWLLLFFLFRKAFE